MDVFYNLIRGQVFQRNHFKTNLDEGQAELLLYTYARWLSRNIFLQRFRDLLSDIKFLEGENIEYHYLKDKIWLCDLAFLVDFT